MYFLNFLLNFMFSNEEFNYENPSADELFTIILLEFSKYEEKNSVKGIRGNRMYTILNHKFNDVCSDDNGAYRNSRSTKKIYQVSINKASKALLSKTIHEGHSGFYYNQRKGGHSYDKINVSEEEVFILERYYRECKSVPGLKRMVARVKAMNNSLYEPHCCVVYSLQKECQYDVQIQAHGNCKDQGDRSYIRTSVDTLRKEDQQLKENPGLLYQFHNQNVNLNVVKIEAWIIFSLFRVNLISQIS